jgi:putative SOS response-associated peptidase YedK
VKTLNAFGETIFDKPSFRSIKSKRGLLPIDGFFEWCDFNKKKYPYFITLKEEGLFSLG